MGSITAQATPEFTEAEPFLFIFLAAVGERQILALVQGAHQGIWVEVIILPVFTEVFTEGHRAAPGTLESIRHDP